MGCGSALFLVLGTNYVLLRVASIVWLRTRWSVIIFTLYGMEGHDLASWGIIPSKNVLHTSPCLTVLHKVL